MTMTTTADPSPSPRLIPPDSLRLEVDLEPRIHLAAQQNSVPTLRSVVIENLSPEALDGLEIRFRVDPEFVEPWTVTLSELKPHGRCVLGADHVNPWFSTSRLMAQSERQAGGLFIELALDGRVLRRARYDIELLAPTEWVGSSLLPELLAAFVLPNHPALKTTLEQAVDLLRAHFDPSVGLSGYQSKDPRYVVAMVQALYTATQATGVRYANPPASFETTGQRIRTPDQVLHGLGTCLDLTVVMAALMEQAGLHPFLVVVEGHAFPGCWLQEFMLQDPTIDDAALISKRIRLGEAVVFDSSAIASGVGFDAAKDHAERMIHDRDRFRFAVDVARARKHRILPLSFEIPKVRDAAAPSAEGMVARDAEAFEPFAHRLASPPSHQPTDPDQPLETAEMRRNRWKEKLLDLSLRNRLLNFKEGKRTVAFPFVELGPLEDRLADGRAFRLAPRSTSFDEHDPRSEALHASRLNEDVHEKLVREDQQRGVLRASATPAALDKALLELYRSARTVREETGVTTLYLAMGMLRWFESASSREPRSAPLFLVPVELRRLDGGRAYEVAKTDEDPRINVTLLKKLEADFGLKTSGLDVLPEDDRGYDVDRVLADITRLVADQPRWDIDDTCHLAEFSFAKFLMWQDLEGRLDDLKENPVFAHILEGKREAYPLAHPLVGEELLDTARPAHELLTVVDADPTQLQAILAAEDGSSFVLQGPPGTGKSQTITNLVAQLLGQGRTVLFVSEKMAALSVVHTRLTRAGLGPFCLELHSNKANKRAVLDQLKESFHGAAAAAPGDWGSAARELEHSRARLNDFARLLGESTSFGPTLHAALSRLIGLRSAPRVDLGLSDPSRTSESQLQGWRELVGRLVRACETAGGSPAESPWRACRALEWSESWERAARDAIARFIADLDTARSAYEAARNVLGIDDAGTSWRRLRDVRALAGLLLESPAPPRALVEAGPTQRVPERLEAWSALVLDRRRRHAHVAEVFRDAVLQLELEDLISRFRRWSGSFFLVRFFALMGARRRLRPYLARGRLPAPAEVASTLEEALEVRRRDDLLMGAQPEASALLGPTWRGVETDLDRARETVDDAARFRQRALELSEQLGDDSRFGAWCSLFTERNELVRPGTRRAEALSAFVEAFDRLDASERHLELALSLDRVLAFGPAPTLQRLIEVGRSLESEISELRAHCLVRKAEDEARRAGLGRLCDALDEGRIRVDELRPAFERGFHEAWWEDLVRREPRLRDFQGREHMAGISRFKQLDEQCLALARREVAVRLAGRAPAPDAPGDEMGVLRAQFQKKRAHMPIRKMFSRIPGILRRLKPCLLMSPLSVAQYLDPSIDRFDVVIFDEASQIPPWDAVGAIARGNQVIIVGDTKQLPPTSFFDRASRDDDEELYDEHDIEDLESILNEALASGIPELSLKWHYRSRHESLIAFSNHKYYDGRLRTFPSAAHRVPELGVELRSVPDGYYDRGGSRTNRAEAELVVREIVQILDRHHGDKSVGVVTFSQAQQSLIQDLVDQLLQNRKDLVDRFDSKSEEHVFIKNLENVQGDERDVMLFSICYGPDRAGKVTMNFGPLNRDGGERRLNVAITRARERLVVFSTLRADQIDTSKTRAVGASHLKTFLDYAERGIVAIDAELSFEGREPDSPFEEDVLAVLRERGWKVTPQVGVSGYRIDLAVEHPDRPGAFLLAIECDGATYHGSLYARERDRLRQAVLEGLGWNVYRIWSTDWWYDREGQIEKLASALEAALQASRSQGEAQAEALRRSRDESSGHEAALAAKRGSATVAAPPIAPQESVGTLAEVEARLQSAAPALRAEAARHPIYRAPEVRPLGSSDDFYDEASTRRVAQTLAQVVQSYGPIERDQAFRIVAGAWGLSGLGSRIRRIIDRALFALPRDRRPVVADGALFAPGQDPAAYRGFRVPDPDDERTKRRVEHIPVQELVNACEYVVAQAKSIGRDDLAKETARLFGIERMGKKVVETLDGAIDRLGAEGRAEVGRDRVRAK